MNGVLWDQIILLLAAAIRQLIKPLVGYLKPQADGHDSWSLISLVQADRS
jgi:hypothetical protein